MSQSVHNAAHDARNGNAPASPGPLQEPVSEDLDTATRLLMESAARARAVLDVADEAIVSFNDHGIIESFNHAAEQLYGYDRSEVLGR